MKHMQIVEVPATTREVVDHVTCDLCGEKIPNKVFDRDEVSVEAIAQLRPRVKIERVTGSEYPEGGWLEATLVDMCGTCFETKLVPWLKSLGVEPRKEDRSW